MRIALVSPYDFSYPGGVTKHIINLAKSFQQRGHQVHIIAASSRNADNMSPGITQISSFVVPVRYNGSIARISFSPRLAQQVRALLGRETFDVLHLHEPTTPTLPWVVLRQAQKLSPQTALVGTFHSYRERRGWKGMPSEPYSYARPIFRRVVNRLDGRIVVSKVAHDYVNNHFPGSYRVIPNGVDVALFGNPSLEPLSQFSTGLNLLFVGRPEPRKGFLYLIEAYARVKVTLPESRLLVIGPYTAKDRAPFEQELRQRQLGDVHFIGYVPDVELARYYQSSHVFCAPSTDSESFGMVLLEAMAAKTPIVASDIAGYRAVVGHQREGLLTPPKDPAALAEAIIYLLQRPDLRQAMGARGQAKASLYTWERVADSVLDCYHDILEGKRDSGVVWNSQSKPRERYPHARAVLQYEEE
ncbi:MAG: glycosyltransferase family 4 protein [Anaerolineales bacterium]|nr:MAG: glycosyltransferase family 4 protein [Anaerolineales bacterium]